MIRPIPLLFLLAACTSPPDYERIYDETVYYGARCLEDLPPPNEFLSEKYCRAYAGGVYQMCRIKNNCGVVYAAGYMSDPEMLIDDARYRE